MNDTGSISQSDPPWITAFTKDWHDGTIPVPDLASKYGISRNRVTDLAKSLSLGARPGRRGPGNNPIALTRGEWVYDPVRRIKVWQSWSRS